MTHQYQEFKLKKLNDYGRCQNRTLQFRDNAIAALNGSKVKREIEYDAVTGVTYNIEGKYHEFVIHWPKGDLRYR